jgi:hypothetical protein
MSLALCIYYRGDNYQHINAMFFDDFCFREVVSAGGLLHPVLLPKIYPPMFDLYALYNDKMDEKYWERVQKLNKQGDVALMAYLGVDQ